MKSFNEIKSKKSGWLLTLAVAVAASGFVLALDPPENPYSKSEFKKENQDIRQDMKGITASRDRIDALQAKLERDRDAKNKMAVIADKKNLAKAKADLRREKAYLCADKKDLKADHAYSIGQTRAEVKKERKELYKAKCQLKKDLRKNNSYSLRSDIDEIEKQQRQLDYDLAVLDRKTEAKNTELAAVNDELVEAGIRNEFVAFKKQDRVKGKEETAQALDTKAKSNDDNATASANKTRDAEWLK